ncbi:hypothetical protein D1R32_gp402 [Tunisvirus fontaine2]|uniref:Uncharacterized protein n=1 Tax=Tunisvirus fontaine2 TaxID=1421067 RepID=V9SGU5_9VIRU|nr:hypothetical protein D1R32_gp402 [Tunisvirus fontaine2]AHC55119.1 hypothetical protein TNS_ORF401 [Tunisvirus fontaine2]
MGIFVVSVGTRLFERLANILLYHKFFQQHSRKYFIKYFLIGFTRISMASYKHTSCIFDKDTIISHLAKNTDRDETYKISEKEERQRVKCIVYFVTALPEIGLQDRVAFEHFRKHYCYLPSFNTILGLADDLVRGEMYYVYGDKTPTGPREEVLVSIGLKRELVSHYLPMFKETEDVLELASKILRQSAIDLSRQKS